MSLTVLGCTTPYPQPDQPCSGYLVRSGATTVWIDIGSGTLAELQRHIRIEDVDLIWVSHLHPDHSADLLAAWNYYVNTDGAPRPVVAGPPRWADHADMFLGRPGAMGEAFNVVDLEDGATLRIGELTLTARLMKHGVPTYGVRIASEAGAVLAYSADSAPCPELVELAANADVLLIEAGADTEHDGHSTPEEAAKVAADADVRHVVLTHLAPGMHPNAAAMRAARLCPVSVDVAYVGRTVLIHPTDDPA